MQDTETVSNTSRCQIISIDGVGSRRGRQIAKQQGRIRTADARFASLDEKSQRIILSHMIGYMKASKDLISSGRRAGTNEVSKIFGAMESLINKSWNGGID